MDKDINYTVFYYIGNNIFSIPVNLFNRPSIILLDSENEHQTKILHHNYQTINLKNVEEIRHVMDSETISHVVILSEYYVFDDWCQEYIISLFNKLLTVLKGITPHLTISRKGKVWIMSPLCTNCETLTPVNKTIIHSLSSGFKMITDIYATELAKKNINANFIKRNTISFYEGLEKVLTWAETSPFSLTTQELKL